MTQLKFLTFLLGTYTSLCLCDGILCESSPADVDEKIKNNEIVQYDIWKDSDGNPINAHGGGILFHDSVYYWYGEYKTGETILPEWATWECFRTNIAGISCYSSKDLNNWKFEGIVLPPEKNDSTHDLHPSNVLERPKVLYNSNTKKFVMWVHVDSPDYSKAATGVATSDSPTGLFTYLGSFRPNDAMSRDQTIFVDDDGKAYQFYSSEDNATLYASELTSDYLLPSGNFTRNFIGESREAPAVFKNNGKYYMLTSGCTGWSPNSAQIAVADHPLGPWKAIGNPCSGSNAEITFHSQSTFVLPVGTENNRFIAMFDRWNKHDLKDSRYVWLPIEFNNDGSVEIAWRPKWRISDFK